MKARDFVRIFVFVLIFLLLNRSLGDLFVNWSRSGLVYEQTRQDFEAMQEDISVIVLGDSHAQKGVIAAEITGGYNFSSSAESYIFTYYKTKYYLERGRFRPEVAVVPVDLHSFSSFRLMRVATQDPAYWDRYINYTAYGREAGELLEFLPTIVEAKSGLLGGIDAIPDWAFEGKPIYDPLVAGYLPVWDKFSNTSLQEQKDWSAKRAAFHFEGYTFMDDVLVDYFLRLLDLLDAYDVKIVLVYYPVSEYYYDFAGTYIPVESHLSTIESVLEGYPYELVLDYHDLFFGQPENFYNADHLNVQGAEIFTSILIEDLAEAGLLPADQ